MGIPEKIESVKFNRLYLTVKELALGCVFVALVFFTYFVIAPSCGWWMPCREVGRSSAP
jgi:hypothetical protein